MTGWLVFAGVAGVAALLLWVLRMPRGLATFVLSALMLAGAGYAWQGRPDLNGSPVATKAAVREIDPEIIGVRTAIFGRFGETAGYQAAADAMVRAGKTESAVAVMIGAVRKSKDDPAAWTGLGNALVAHDGNAVSPAAKLAFGRAAQLAPNSPGPPFFLGLAYATVGDLKAARGPWRRALALSPEGASYRMPILVRVFVLERLIAIQDAGAAGR